MRTARSATATAAFDGVGREFPSFSGRPIATGRHLAMETSSTEAPRRLRVRYALGRVKIEQHLTPAPGGRLQALPIGFDTVRREWFDIFPEAPPRDAWEHWTGPGMTANTQCLSCHTTGYDAGYDPQRDTYESRWAEGTVGCEACHGPGSEHARRRAAGEEDPTPYGAIALRARTMESCVPCHSRRVEIAAGYVPGEPVLDHYDLELLDTDAYHPDGQLLGESYEWTSFQMSRMAERGVVCQDCHEPHASRVRVEGNALCLRCHDPKLDEASHTHHAKESAGSRCVSCHMPAVVFMERDERHDHRIAPPDPEGARAVGSRDPCLGCHADQSSEWSAATISAWGGTDPSAARRRTARAIAAARRGQVEAVQEDLIAVVGSPGNRVVRASAARLLEGATDDRHVEDALLAATTDEDPLVRAGAVASLGEGRQDTRVEAALTRAARDPVRLVRVNAGYALRAADLEHLDDGAKHAVQSAFDEWLTAQAGLAELPEPNFNRGVFFTARQDTQRAEEAYRAAIARWPSYLPARQNLAQLLAATGREEPAIAEFRAIEDVAPAWPPGLFSSGLLYGRLGRWDDAVRQLERCVAANAGYPRAFYNLGEAYVQTGNDDRAARAFERAVDDPAARADALRELVRLAYRRQDRDALARWLPDALRADPNLGHDPTVRDALEGAGGH